MRIAVDVGTVRVGVAVSDRDGLVAVPLETLARDERGGRDVQALAQLVRERDAVEVVVGLPRSLSGAEGRAAVAVRTYAETLARAVTPVPVRVVDERFTTVTAHRTLRGAGVRGRRARQVVDQVAAVTILQDALALEAATGRPPGTLVVPPQGPERPGPVSGPPG